MASKPEDYAFDDVRKTFGSSLSKPNVVLATALLSYCLCVSCVDDPHTF